MKKHDFQCKIDWCGNLGTGTSAYHEYSRDHLLNQDHKYSSIQCSSDPIFRGDKTKYNPEEFFIASVASCHMLWYLHLCADRGVVVIDYQDEVSAELILNEDGSGKINNIVLKPQIKITNAKDIELAQSLHHEAHRFCFIAASVNCNIEIRSNIFI